MGAARPEARRTDRRAFFISDTETGDDLRAHAFPAGLPAVADAARECQSMSVATDVPDVSHVTRMQRERRRRRVLDLDAAEWSAPEIAQEVGISERQVYRILARGRTERTCPACGHSHTCAG